MSRDGKDTFYRNLELDDETRKIIKWYRRIFKQMMRSAETEQFIERETDEV